MTKKKKNKVKTIIKYVNKAEDQKKVNEDVKREITELEDKRKETGTGVRGFLRKAALNKAINERRSFLRSSDKAKMTKREIEITRNQIELEKSKQELSNLRKKREVDFSGLVGTSPKKINFNDLYS